MVSDVLAVHLINPSDFSFGIGFMAPRWLYVIADATPERFGVPQITDETLDPLDSSKIQLMGALVGVEAVTPEGLKDVHKNFNEVGEQLVDRLRALRHHGVHVLGSFIFGLPSDRAGTFDATVAIAERANITFAQFLMLTPFPGTTDFAQWEQMMARYATRIAGQPLTRHWLIPQPLRPKVFTPHPLMSS